MQETIFSKIIRKEIPAKIVYEDEKSLAFHDINPKAPVHILVIPKKFIPTLDDAKQEDVELLGQLLLTAQKVAKLMNLDKGYRVIMNCKNEGGQEVYHIHLHLVGGKNLGRILA